MVSFAISRGGWAVVVWVGEWVEWLETLQNRVLASVEVTVAATAALKQETNPGDYLLKQPTHTILVIPEIPAMARAWEIAVATAVAWVTANVIAGCGCVAEQLRVAAVSGS